MKKFEEALLKLNNKLEKDGIYLDMIVVGGSVLEYNEIRATIDIDAFYKTNQTIDDYIYEIGEELNLNSEDEIWLNNSVSSMNKKPSMEICELIYDFSNLKIYIPPLEYVMGMKLESMREQDIEDVAEIIKLLEIEDVKEIEIELKKYNFNFDESVLLESFSIAYGLEWLENYYLNIEKNIIKKEPLKNKYKGISR